jgi:signal transduction histidine kinase/ActR/RegA family two-component response regulator
MTNWDTYDSGSGPAGPGQPHPGPDFRAFFEAGPASCLVLTPDLTIVAASDGYLRDTGTERAGLIGQSILDIFPERPDPGGVAALRASLDRVCAEQATDTMPVQRHDLGPAGAAGPAGGPGELDTRYWSVRNMPVLGAAGGLDYIIHWLTDVTDYMRLSQDQAASQQLPAERRSRAQWVEAHLLASSRDLAEANRALRQANAALRTAYDNKQEFLDRLSHELRTPLNTVLGFGELLSLDGVSGQHREWIGMAMQATRHLAQLLDEARDVARIESRTLALAIEAVPVHPLIADVLELIRPLSLSSGVQLAPAPRADSVQYVRADEQRLRQVLLNLLSNAVKYNHPAGTVTVGVQAEPGERIRISVTDTGRGIAAEDLGRLFLPFERLDAASAGVAGTGLGLALSRDLIEAMGGSTGVTSTPGAGSTFWVELPATEPAAVAQHAISRDAIVSSRDYASARTILYVEDMVENLRLVEQILKQRPSVTVLSAMLGGVALDLAREHHPDMILLDLRLPDMPGEDILRELRADPLTCDIPVVILSADATRARAQQLQAEGIRDFLAKPIDVRSLLATVDTTLGEAAAAPDAAPAGARTAPSRRPARGYWGDEH